MPNRLRSLELHGYKTFASRTQFEFDGAVTAIVGPNGSGKSNIADALRWVLGEQSFSILRGKKTEDMIFAGSEQRSRAGMASATVVFDNSDGWLPIDFSEVAIARRAYRDGENEYLLNSQRVRLRDVSELLAQSGLAERTYTIIGQGLVDAALALKAEERRRLFEEAAGIALYRSRRDEALRRLETTQRNLDRVQDILAEIEPRLRSLERQARRVQEYEQVKADLREVLREWYGYHWHRAQAELAEAKEAARRQKKALENVRQEQSELDQRLKSFRERIMQLRAQLNAWHRQSAELHNKRETASRSLAVAEERYRALQDQEQRSRAEMIKVEEALVLGADRLQEARQQLQRVEEDLKDAESQSETVNQAIQIRLKERHMADAAVESARQSLAALIGQKSDLSARLAERRLHFKQQGDSLQKAIHAGVESQERVYASRNLIQEVETKLQEVESATQAIENRLSGQRQRQESLELERKNLAAQQVDFQADLTRWRAQLEVMEQAEQTLADYASGARVLLQAAREARLKGAQGALSNFLDTPDRLENAIVAALGEFTDAIVLNRDSDLEEALHILEGSKGRGALLPLAGLSPAPRLSFPSGEGVIGVAADQVSAPDELRPIVDLLLGQVLVVEDRAAAWRIVAELKRGKSDRNRLMRIVTLKGEMFHGNGPILAGQEDRSKVLSRSRRRNTLIARIAKTEQALSELKNRIQASSEKIEKSAASIERSVEELNTTRQEEERLRIAYRREELALEQAQHQVEWQVQHRSRQEEEVHRGEEQASRWSLQIEALANEIEQAQERLQAKVKALSDLPVDEFQSNVFHWNTRLAVIKQSESTAKSRVEEQQAILAKVEHEIGIFGEELKRISVACSRTEEETSLLRETEVEISLQIEELDTKIEPVEKNLIEVEGQQFQSQADEGRARQALNQAEHYHAQAKIALARRQEALDALRRRIEDDFGLVAFEYDEDISGPTPLPLQGMVEQLPRVSEISIETEETLNRQRALLRRMGPINPEAISEYRQVKERFGFLTSQVADLHKAEGDIRQVIADLDVLMEREFQHTFTAVADEFHKIFNRLFGGGSARLLLTDPDDLTASGIDIEARLPGRREQGLSLLSGGERSLTAVALVFALLRVSPTPFCVLDEVDAMLDEVNVGRFRELLRELSQQTQFIIITHNRNTVQVADVIYGVTMGRDSTSQTVSLKIDEVGEVVTET